MSTSFKSTSGGDGILEVDNLICGGSSINALNDDTLSRAINIKYPPSPLTASIGDGITDDTAAIQAVINDIQSAGGGIVWIPQGVFLYTEISITQPWVTIDGPGILMGGKIVIGNSTLPQDLHFKIKNITLKHDSITNDKNGIELQNARIGSIENVLFRNCDKAIYVRPIDGVFFQHCNKISIMDNDFKNVNYCLYIDRPSVPTQAFQIGDFTFSRNKAYGDVNYFHIYGLGVDGISCKGNFLFFPGSSAESSTKENHIYIDVGNWVHVEGNHLFESGKESVLLSKCRNFQIVNNPIAWAGQRVESDAIRIINGDASGAKTNIGEISNNSIEYPTKNGVSIEGVSGYITVGNNSIREAGYSGHYYGGPPLGSTHYGVNVEATCEMVNVVGNIMPENALNVLGSNNFYDNNIESGLLIKRKQLVTTLSGTETTTAAGKYDQINLNQSSATNITGLSGGYEGKQIIFIAFNGNTTLTHTVSGADTFRLKGAVNATITTDGTITFKYSQNKWYEVSRSF